MSALPFALRRPALLARDLVVDRHRPDLAKLRAIADPERFVWAVLPHAARSFSACIALLPGRLAPAAAVGYLYCRMLDTYEDLEPDPAARDAALAAFAARFDGEEMAPPPPLRAPVVQDVRDAAHLLLVERCAAVDAVHARLTPEHRGRVRQVVAAMAESMRWSSRAFAEQGGVLRDAAQLTRYCDGVMGQPVRFALRLGLGRDLSPAEEAGACRIGEYVQLANIVRDVEKDLARGVAYRPEMQPDLGGDPASPATAARVLAARRALLSRALELAPAYRGLVDGLPFPRWSFARSSAVLMQLFTDRFYSGCAARVGLAAWRAPVGGLRLFARALPAFFSRRAAARTLARLEAEQGPARAALA
jgi:phytoene/squalene synthetase